MKAFFLGMIPALLALASCGMNSSYNGTGSFDPLAPPGSGSQIGPASYGPDLAPGAFVSANIPNSAFYKNKPRDNEDADKLLEQGTNMKIVAVDTDYVKVELDSGEVGWVPTVMVASGAPENYPIDGSDQIYPPIPVIDPNGLPPEGSIPAIIDPDAPAPGDPIKIDPVPELKPLEPEAKPEEGEAEKADD